MACRERRVVYLEGVTWDGNAHVVGVGWRGTFYDYTAGGPPTVEDWDNVLRELVLQFQEVTDVWWVVLPEADRVCATWGAREHLAVASPEEHRLWQAAQRVTREWPWACECSGQWCCCGVVGMAVGGCRVGWGTRPRGVRHAVNIDSCLWYCCLFACILAKS